MAPNHHNNRMFPGTYINIRAGGAAPQLPPTLHAAPYWFNSTGAVVPRVDKDAQALINKDPDQNMLIYCLRRAKEARDMMDILTYVRGQDGLRGSVEIWKRPHHRINKHGLIEFVAMDSFSRTSSYCEPQCIYHAQNPLRLAETTAMLYGKRNTPEGPPDDHFYCPIEDCAIWFPIPKVTAYSKTKLREEAATRLKTKHVQKSNSNVIVIHNSDSEPEPEDEEEDIKPNLGASSKRAAGPSTAPAKKRQRRKSPEEDRDRDQDQDDDEIPTRIQKKSPLNAGFSVFGKIEALMRASTSPILVEIERADAREEYRDNWVTHPAWSRVHPVLRAYNPNTRAYTDRFRHQLSGGMFGLPIRCLTTKIGVTSEAFQILKGSVVVCDGCSCAFTRPGYDLHRISSRCGNTPLSPPIDALLDAAEVQEPPCRTYPVDFTVEDHADIQLARDFGADDEFGYAWTELNSRLGIPQDTWAVIRTAVAKCPTCGLLRAFPGHREHLDANGNCIDPGQNEESTLSAS